MTRDVPFGHWLPAQHVLPCRLISELEGSAHGQLWVLEAGGSQRCPRPAPSFPL